MPLSLTNILSNHNPSKAYTQPAFAIWSNQGSYGGFSTYDHNYNCIAREMISNNDYAGGHAMSSTGAPEMFDNWSNSQQWLTNSTASSTTYYCKGTNSVGFLGNLAIPMGEGFAGDLAGSTGAPTYRGHAFRDVGTVVNETDQSYAVWIRYLTTSTYALVIGPRSAQWYYSQVASRADARMITVTNKNSGYASNLYGCLSYNVKTGKLCILEQSGSYTMKPTVYSNVPVLKQYAENQYYNMTEQSAAYTARTGSNLYTHFNTSANYSTSYAAATGKPTSSTTEDNQRCIPVMCDNGKIVMFQMIPSWGFWMHRWNADGSAEGSIISSSWTTSYGVDQGTAYGARYQVSSDGRYVLAYCASYYYSCGCYVALIRVSDGKTLYDFVNDSTYGYNFTPIGKSDFACFNDTNGDGGAGVYFQHISSDYLMYVSADKARINMCRSFLTQIFSNNYNSTDYPTIIPLVYDTKLFNNL